MVLTAVLAAVVAVRARPEVLFDDAAITFRYAARLADGAGYTFNDGDRTNGASAPLYTLLLAASARLGVRPETSAVVLGVVGYVSSAVLCAALARRAAGWLAAVITVALLVTSTVFQNQALSGMESSLAAALGLAALLAFSLGRDTLAGVVVGLALVNRVDALALAVAVYVAVRWGRGRVPRPMALATGLVAAPWYLWSWVYFGSPLPHSATQKLGGEVVESSLDPTWFLRLVTGREGIVVFLLACALPFLWISRLRTGASRRDRAVAAVGAGLLWAGGHTLAYSTIDLGAPYPWYTAVVFPVLCTAAGVALGWLQSLARRPGRASVPVRVGFVSALVLLVVSRAPAVVHTATTVLDGAEPRATRALDGTRRAAGRYVADVATSGEVVRTCFGWVAYGAIDQPIDEVCPLSTREPVGEPTWFVESPGPGEPLVTPTGAARVAEFVAPEVDGVSGRTVVYRRT